MNDNLITVGGGGWCQPDPGGGNEIPHWPTPADQGASVRHLMLRVVAPLLLKMLHLKLLAINIVADVAGFLTISFLYRCEIRLNLKQDMRSVSTQRQ
jgi:hypothetical protein